MYLKVRDHCPDSWKKNMKARNITSLLVASVLVMSSFNLGAQPPPLNGAGNYTMGDLLGTSGSSSTSSPSTGASGTASVSTGAPAGAETVGGGSAEDKPKTTEMELADAAQTLPQSPAADEVRASVEQVIEYVKTGKVTQASAASSTRGVTSNVTEGNARAASTPAQQADAAYAETSASLAKAASGLVDARENLNRAEAQDKAAAAKGGASEVAQVEQSYTKAREHLDNAEKKLETDRAETKGLWAKHKGTILTVGALAAVGVGALLLTGGDDDKKEATAPGNGAATPLPEDYHQGIHQPAPSALAQVDGHQAPASQGPSDIEDTQGTSFGFQSGMNMPGSRR